MSPVELTPGHLTYMNLGTRYLTATIQSLTSRQRKAVGKYVEHFRTMLAEGTGLFLWGENGSGKSYISAALCKMAWGEYRVASYCITAAELKECWINDRPAHEGSEETVTARTERVRLLVVDDLGKEHRTASGFAETKFGQLLRCRARAKRTTIITANMTLGEFLEIYGPSTAQLAKECLYPVKLSGEDLRELAKARIEKELSR